MYVVPDRARPMRTAGHHGSTAKRTRARLLPKEAVNPDKNHGLDTIVHYAVDSNTRPHTQARDQLAD